MARDKPSTVTSTSCQIKCLQYTKKKRTSMRRLGEYLDGERQCFSGGYSCNKQTRKWAPEYPGLKLRQHRANGEQITLA